MHFIKYKSTRQTYLQKRNRVTDVENKLMVTKGGRERGINHWLTHTIIYKITNRNLLYSTGNSNQYCVMTYIYGKRSENGGRMCMYN